MKHAILFVVFCVLGMNGLNAMSKEMIEDENRMDYTVSFEDAKGHYVTVEISYTANSTASVFKVPVWTPGSYKVREFSLNMEDFEAFEGTTALEVVRRDKNSWVVSHANGSRITMRYKAYAFVVSTRRSYVDEHYAFLHGVSTFGYVEGREDDPILLTCKPLQDWKNVEMAVLPVKDDPHQFMLANYDLLADSPIALGNFDVATYESDGVPHRVVMIGEGNYDLERIEKDFKKISDAEMEIFGGNPCDIYIHFIQNTMHGSGGLEHMNCQTSSMDRFGYSDEGRYARFLGLIAHEYFHLWNVKRIRPVELGPFDYDKENYTTMLWIAEGVTSYFDDLCLYRAGYTPKESYINQVAGQIQRYENTPGKDHMSLEESSQLAWIKSYLPNENSHNRSISYYNKGMLVAFLLDLRIVELTKGKKGLEDVMKALYEQYLYDPSRGFTFDEFVEVCEQTAGGDLSDVFSYVSSTGTIPYQKYLDPFGLELQSSPETDAWSGISSSSSGNVVTVNKIVNGSPAEQAGLSVNDEILAVNGWRLSQSFEQFEDKKAVGTRLDVLYSRDGKVYTTHLILEDNPSKKYTIEIREETKLMECWLKGV